MKYAAPRPDEVSVCIPSHVILQLNPTGPILAQMFRSTTSRLHSGRGGPFKLDFGLSGDSTYFEPRPLTCSRFRRRLNAAQSPQLEWASFKDGQSLPAARSRFLAVHSDSISTRPSAPVA